MMQCFFAKLNESMKLLRSEGTRNKFWGKYFLNIAYEMSYNTCLIFPEKKNHRAKRIKAGVDTSKFVVRSHKGAIMRFFDRAEDMYRI